jgi:hypothetical protein
MTLCIAAESELDGDAAIVLCADWRAQTGAEAGLLVGTENSYKIKDAGSLSVLIAGRPSDAHELLTLCRGAVNNFCASTSESDSDLAISAFQRGLRDAAGKRKEEIVEEYVKTTLGIAYEELRRTRSECLTDTHLEVWREIKHLDLGADLLFCGFCGKVPVIVRLDRFGRSPWETNYAVIGEGGEIARAMLCLQEWSHAGSKGYLSSGDIQPVALDQCIYRLYEAKTAAHKAHPSSVGIATAFQIIVCGKGKFGLKEECQDGLHEIFDGKHVVPDTTALSSVGRVGKKRKTLANMLTVPVRSYRGVF